MTSNVDELWDLCGELARQENILAIFVGALDAAGVVGEERAGKLLYLVVTSRWLDRPVSAAVKAASSTGKSHTVDTVLRFFPDSSYFVLSSSSEKGLIHLDETLAHRVIVVNEWAGVRSELGDYFFRSLLSEGCIRYLTTTRTPHGPASTLIVREGPTGLLTTSTHRLHPENETRMLSIPLDESVEQTRRVLLRQAQGGKGTVTYERWHALQEWIGLGSPRVVVPFAEQLAEAIIEPPLRARRDFIAVLNLIRAHALLHRFSRQRDEKGRILATVADYAVVRELVVDLVGVDPEFQADPTLKQTVEAVERIGRGGSRVTNDAVAAALRIDKSNACRRVRNAIRAGYLVNRSRPGAPADLAVVGTADTPREILPTVEALSAQPRNSATAPGPDALTPKEKS